jgi:hypothetical protein
MTAPVYLIDREPMMRISTSLEPCAKGLPMCSRAQVDESIATKMPSAEMELARVFY